MDNRNQISFEYLFKNHKINIKITNCLDPSPQIKTAIGGCKCLYSSITQPTSFLCNDMQHKLTNTNPVLGFYLIKKSQRHRIKLYIGSVNMDFPPDNTQEKVSCFYRQSSLIMCFTVCIIIFDLSLHIMRLLHIFVITFSDDFNLRQI